MAKKAAAKKNTLSADAALKRLEEGNARFLAHDPINYQTLKERADFARGQQPYAAVLSCADSRVSPELMFNTGLDELFVVRVAGNIATTEAIASIEYAVANLNTNLIVVLGHEGCGAVNAAVANAECATDLGHNLNALVAHLTPAVAAAQKKKSYEKDPLTATVRENSRLTAKSLRARSPIIAKERGVKIVAGYYHLMRGKVSFSKYL